MPLRTDPTGTRRSDRPTRPPATADDNVELYGDDGEVVLAVELPGFDPDDIEVTWDEGTLNVRARRVDEGRGRRRTVRRRFRLPDTVAGEDATATYENGVLEVRLPAAPDAGPGREIPVAN